MLRIFQRMIIGKTKKKFHNVDQQIVIRVSRYFLQNVSVKILANILCSHILLLLKLRRTDKRGLKESLLKRKQVKFRLSCRPHRDHIER